MRPPSPTPDPLADALADIFCYLLRRQAERLPGPFASEDEVIADGVAFEIDDGVCVGSQPTDLPDTPAANG